MKNKYLTILVMGLFAISLFAVMALAQPTGGATSVGTAESWTGTASTSTATEGGNITELNVSGYAQTGRWAGFWGEITGGFRLADSSAEVFYEWTISDPTDAVVYAANGTVSNWAGVVAAGVGDMPSFLTTAATDNYTNTFDNTELFTSASMSIITTPYASTWQNGAQGVLKTYALKDGADSDIIWAGKAISDAQAFQAAGTVDYQILVPADSTPITYNFYLELQ